MDLENYGDVSENDFNWITFGVNGNEMCLCDSMRYLKVGVWKVHHFKSIVHFNYNFSFLFLPEGGN